MGRFCKKNCALGHLQTHYLRRNGDLESRTMEKIIILSWCTQMNLNHPFFPEVEFVFLDRDGVINRKPVEGDYICDWSRFVILPGVEEAIRTLNHSGKTVAVVTNQRGIALGLYTERDLADIHHRLQDHFRANGGHIDAFYYCPHDRNQCDCRKPGTALLEKAFHDFPGARAHNSLLIGDSLSDIQAAKKMDMRSIFIEGESDRQKPGAEQAAKLADTVCSSLFQAVALIG
jgi:D-glycero-D-manno-heptose 1,7-bisphosphate phosphatase